ncbi:MAG: hypothetical protein CSA21_06775 [Deltaproteobacteria bacterium]|nr:MAG: hypothetical protein CSA21_06775 [Deltaproteobacteria bacterium]
MKTFDYHEPVTAVEACQCLKELGEGASIIAGGTDLIIQMKQGRIAPKYLVNIANITELSEVKSETDGIRIGATALLSAVVDNPDINKDSSLCRYVSGTGGT